MNYKIKKISWWFGFSGFTVYPYILKIENDLDIKHEEVHIKQQHNWYKYGWYFGVFAWLFCYLFMLPIFWNPLRWSSEYEAYTKGSKYSDAVTIEILKNKYWILG